MRRTRKDSASEDTSPSPEHFLNLYSTSSIAEDRAEVWSHIMTKAKNVTPSSKAKAGQDEKPLFGKAKALMKRAMQLGDWSHLQNMSPWKEYFACLE